MRLFGFCDPIMDFDFFFYTSYPIDGTYITTLNRCELSGLMFSVW